MAVLAALSCLSAAGPASATVAYVGTEDPAAPTRNGSTLTSDTGEWACIPGCLPPSYAWERCTTICATVPGRTGRTYQLDATDVGLRIRSVITMVDSLGLDAESRASAQTSTITGDAPPSTLAVRLLRPFPVVVIAGRLRRGRTVLAELTVRGPRGARVGVRCRGAGCPFRRTGGTIGRRKRLRLRKAERSYRAGIALEIRITARDKVGKFTRIRFRRRGAPTRTDSCLRPGATRPSPCP